jgi:uncharacterized protein (DUF736 family)
MSQVTHKELYGALFANRKKNKPEQPDRTGTATIGGISYRIAGWIREDKEGNAYLSLTFSLPQGREDV